MKNAESADDCVEACGVERKVFGVALAKFDPRMAPSRLRDHVGGEVYSDRMGTACVGAGGDITRPCGHVEDLRAGVNAGCVKQRRDGAGGDLAGQRVVVVGLGSPALPFKFLKGCRRRLVLRHWRHFPS